MLFDTGNILLPNPIDIIAQRNALLILDVMPWPLATAIELSEKARIPIATTGTWVKDGKRFSITHDDLKNIVSNFSASKKGTVVCDYEHASEQPGVARGGPVKAAGWIGGMDLIGGTLYADLEWNDAAAAMIRAGEYKYVSPAIDWGAKDKETGDPIGAKLTSLALTNHPFLEELPALMLSEVALADSNDKVIHVPIPQGDGDFKVKVKVQKKDAAEDKELSEGQKLDELSEQYGEVVLTEDTDATHAKVGSGDSVSRSDFAYVGDPEKKSTWKFPIHNESHVKNALARWGQSKGIPAEEKATVLHKILRAAKKFGVKVDKDNPKYKLAASDAASNGLLQLLQDISVDRQVLLVEQAVSEKFSDATAWPNGNIPSVRDINEDHVILQASDGKLHRLGYKLRDGEIQLDSKTTPVEAKYVSTETKTMNASELYGTPKKIVKIGDGSFIFVADKKAYERGYSESDGKITLSETVRLMAEAELKEKGLPDDVCDRVMSDGVKDDKEIHKELRKEAEKRAADRGGAEEDEEEAVLMELADDRSAVTMKAKRLRMRSAKGKDGVAATKRHAILDDSGKLVGYVTHGDLMEHAARWRKTDAEASGSKDKPEINTRLSEAIQDLTGRQIALSDVVRSINFAAENENIMAEQKARQESIKLVLSECFPDSSAAFVGKTFDRLWADDKISKKDYFSFKWAIEEVEKSIRAGQFIPRLRKTLTKLALSDHDAFAELCKNQPNVIDYGSRGVAGTGLEYGMKNVDQELDERVKQRMTDNKEDRATAMQKVLMADTDLARRYRKEHTAGSVQ